MNATPTLAPSPGPSPEPTKCTKCGRIIPVWESFDFPPDWIAKHPELKGMCMDCYRDWCESHAEAQ